MIAYLRALAASDDPAPMWHAALCCVALSMGGYVVFGLSLLIP